MRRRWPTRNASESSRVTARGYASVDVVALDKRKILLCIVGEVNSRSVAEHAIAFLLASAKRLIRAERAVREGPWGWRNTLEPGDISEKNLLIVGDGRSGRHLATQNVLDVFAGRLDPDLIVNKDF